MIILCRAAETLAASFSFKLSAFRRKKSCKLSSETTERRHHSLINPAFHPYHIVLNSIELVVYIFLQNIRTRITVWLWSSPTTSFSTRGQPWPYSPTFPISKIHQSLGAEQEEYSDAQKMYSMIAFPVVPGGAWTSPEASNGTIKGMDASRVQPWN